jgi:hypothetical protein
MVPTDTSRVVRFLLLAPVWGLANLVNGLVHVLHSS